jgi:hypothetical protein
VVGGVCKNSGLVPLKLDEFIHKQYRELEHYIKTKRNSATATLANYFTQTLAGTLSLNVSRTDYHQAIRKLSLFNTVLITENMSLDEGVYQFSEISRLPEHVICNDTKRKNDNFRQKTTALGHVNVNRKRPQEPGPYEPYYKQLEELNVWDLRLYEFAVKLSAIQANKVRLNPYPDCPIRDICPTSLRELDALMSSSNASRYIQTSSQEPRFICGIL